MTTRLVKQGVTGLTSRRSRPTTAVDVVARWFRAHRPCELVVVDTPSDVGVLADWYAQLLGVPSRGTPLGPPGRADDAGPTTVWVSKGETGRGLLIVAVPRPTGARRGCRHRWDQHVVFEYANVHDLLATHERLEARQIRPLRSSDVCTAIAFCYEDPDGNSVELTFDPHSGQGERDGSEGEPAAAHPADQPLRIGLDLQTA